MRFPSSILSIFNLHGGQQAPEDGVLTVPRILTPVIEIPEQLNRFSATGDSSAGGQQSSFAISNHVEQTNGAGGGTTVCLFAPGLWDIDINVMFTSNYTDVAAANSTVINFVRAPVAGSNVLFFYYAQTNTIVLGRRFTISLPGNPNTSTYLISMGLPANAAAQTLNVAVSIVAGRLG